MASNYWTRRARTTRRGLLQGAGAAALGGAALAAVGCGDDDDNKTSTATAAASASAAASATKSASASATAAAASPVDGSYLSEHRVMTGVTLDMHRELYRANLYQAGLAFNLLVAWKDVDKGEMWGEIAQAAPEQPDKQTYVFTIRDGIKWHSKAPANGRAFTMDDLKWNFERQMSRKLASGEVANNFSRYTQVYQYIDKVESPDDKHLKVTLKEPKAPWLAALCDEFNVIENRETEELVEKDFGTFDAKYLVGTGPFVFDKYNPVGQVHAVKNPDYFLRKAGEKVAYLDEVYWTNLGPDVNAQRAAFEQKQIDEINVAKDLFDSISTAHPEVRKIQLNSPGINIEFGYNYTGNPAFSNPKLRQAIFIAIDRTVVAQQAFQGLARPNPAIAWQLADWAIPQTELETYSGYKKNKDDDIKEARALWQAGGGDAIDAAALEFIIVDTADQSIKEWFPAMMNKNMGINKFSIRSIPVASLLEYDRSQNAVGYLGNWGNNMWSSPDPRQGFADVYSKNGNINFWHYTTPEMEDLITKAFSEFDRTKAITIMKDAQKIALKDGGAGHLQMVGGFNLYLQWPYLHRVGPTGILYEREIGYGSYIDQKDPSFAGRKKP